MLVSVARMPRRALLGGLAVLGASAAGLAVFSDRLLAPSPRQLPTVRRIGYLGAGGPFAPRWVDGLRQGLRDYGWIEGQNIAVEYRFFLPNEQATGLAVDLVNSGLELLFAATSPAAKAAKDATDTLPVVFASVTDPIGQGWWPAWHDRAAT
jgi:putative ABC transport system substrate-binding protein